MPSIWIPATKPTPIPPLNNYMLPCYQIQIREDETNRDVKLQKSAGPIPRGAGREDEEYAPTFTLKISYTTN